MEGSEEGSEGWGSIVFNSYNFLIDKNINHSKKIWQESGKAVISMNNRGYSFLHFMGKWGVIPRRGPESEFLNLFGLRL